MGSILSASLSTGLELSQAASSAVVQTYIEHILLIVLNKQEQEQATH